MDITLLQIKHTEKVKKRMSFNPCFNGYYTFTHRNPGLDLLMN